MLIGSNFQCAHILEFLQMLLVFLQHLIIVFGVLVTNLGGFLHLGDFAVNLLQILALQLKIHNLNVADRIHGTLHMR